MVSAMGPVIRNIREAVVDAARHADDLTNLPRQHGTQLSSMARRVDGQDHFDGKPGGRPKGSSHRPGEGSGRGGGTPSTSWKDTNRGSNSKRTVYDSESSRPISESGTINKDFGSSKRGDNATKVGHIGGEGYDGGHLGAHRFFGDTPDEGIVPQVANLNRSAWSKMESEWADWAKAGFRVEYNIRVEPPGAAVPDSFSVDYTVTDPRTGDEVFENLPRFKNRDGQKFDRVPNAEINHLAQNSG